MSSRGRETAGWMVLVGDRPGEYVTYDDGTGQICIGDNAVVYRSRGACLHYIRRSVKMRTERFGEDPDECRWKYKIRRLVAPEAK